MKLSTFCTECEHKKGEQWWDARCMKTHGKTLIFPFDGSELPPIPRYCAQKNKGHCEDFKATS